MRIAIYTRFELDRHDQNCTIHRERPATCMPMTNDNMGAMTTNLLKRSETREQSGEGEEERVENVVEATR